VKQDRITPIILAGGSGTRLWPLSRQDMPKQFCSIEGDKSLFQKTLDRVDNDELFNPAIIVYSKHHHSIVTTQIMEVNKEVQTLVLEPVGRETAAAIALGIQVAGNNASDQFLVMPSDHEIEDVEGFQRTLLQARSVVQNHGRIVTMGIEPGYPETGFGYIRAGQALGNSNCSQLIEFIEKPNEETAEILIQEKNIFWNAGIFFFDNITIRSEFLKHSAGIFNDVSRAVAMGKWEGKSFHPDADEFSKVNAVSLDYAVMEKTEFASVAPLQSDWSDMGSWNTVWDMSEKNDDMNAVKGNTYMHDTNRCLVQSDGPVVGVCGLEDVVVVANRDAVLVTSRENPQGVKKLVEQMKNDEASVIKSHTGETRPWGRFDSLDKGETHQVKRIKVTPGGQLSLQYHFHRSEHWIVVKGVATVTVNDDVTQLIPGQQVFIPQGAVHRLENFTDEDVEIIEVQYGTYFGEDDIVRVEDIYNRSATETPQEKSVDKTAVA
jgi:mannose-1-phosphate guanylyltransferase/mannose-6-phosphate isomerase